MRAVGVASPNAPRPEDPLTRELADGLARIERNYGREGSGPGSRFEGRLLEDVQAGWIVRTVEGRLSPGAMLSLRRAAAP